jgi:polysaccharide biosynthesis/export protein VpsN
MNGITMNLILNSPDSGQRRTRALLSWLIYPFWLLLFAFSSMLAAQQDPAAYQLGAGDHIVIQVFDEEELSMHFRLNDSGILNYPLLGELKVAGLSLLELEKLITSGLRGDYLINPDVTVSIEEYRAIFINGEVKRPGGFPYQPALTVEKAVSLAGGYTERASRNSFTIVRAKDPTQIISDVPANEPVHPGDVITVNRSFF